MKHVTTKNHASEFKGCIVSFQDYYSKYTQASIKDYFSLTAISLQGESCNYFGLVSQNLYQWEQIRTNNPKKYNGHSLTIFQRSDPEKPMEIPLTTRYLSILPSGMFMRLATVVELKEISIAVCGDKAYLGSAAKIDTLKVIWQQLGKYPTESGVAAKKEVLDMILQQIGKDTAKAPILSRL